MPLTKRKVPSQTEWRHMPLSDLIMELKEVIRDGHQGGFDARARKAVEEANRRFMQIQGGN
jgi:hypothetical protein